MRGGRYLNRLYWRLGILPQDTEFNERATIYRRNACKWFQNQKKELQIYPIYEFDLPVLFDGELDLS